MATTKVIIEKLGDKFAAFTPSTPNMPSDLLARRSPLFASKSSVTRWLLRNGWQPEDSHLVKSYSGFIPAPYGVNWGTTNTSKQDVIDDHKPIKTKCGKRVLDVHKAMSNGSGSEATFPIKGSVVVREHPFKTKFETWTLSGKGSNYSIVNY